METQIERWRYPRFFTENISDDRAVVSGTDAKHISAVLRMRAGDSAVLCDGQKNDYLAKLVGSDNGECVFEILEKSVNQAEPDVRVRLFQAFPKGDKMDFIVQKSVECGVCEIVPMLTERCVSRPDEKSVAKKLERWRKIALEAAKQCGRGKIPMVSAPVTLLQAAENCPENDTRLFFYECSEVPLRDAVRSFSQNIDVVIGSEGGFDRNEAEMMAARGFTEVSLGKRILRCETAPIAALSVIMNLTGN